MKRRIWIKQVSIFIGSSILLSGCVNHDGLISQNLQNIALSYEEENFLIAFVDTVIPSTSTLGAKELKLDAFVLKMFDDCYSAEQQKELISGLSELKKELQEKNGKEFSLLNNAQREKLLNKIKKQDDNSEAVKFFIHETRKWTVKGYQNSEYVMTKLVPYQLVPGHFYGCVKIN